jgi:hypothetical protein
MNSRAGAETVLKPGLTIFRPVGKVFLLACQRSSVVEQCFRKAKVVGSIPTAGSIFKWQLSSICGSEKIECQVNRDNSTELHYSRRRGASCANNRICYFFVIRDKIAANNEI